MTINWSQILPEDYDEALVRLVTVTHSQERYLLFAIVELLPFEVPRLKAIGEKENFGDLTIFCTATLLSVEDALDWYARALNGTASTLEGPKRSLKTVKLGAEPPLGHLSCGSDLPMLPHWHAGTRINQLVPVEELPKELNNALTSERDKIDNWIRDRLQFDLLSYREYVGGLILLAPNPLIRSCTSTLLERLPDGRERALIKYPPRENASLDTLRIRVHDTRPTGLKSYDVQVSGLGLSELMTEFSTEGLVFEVFCTVRGTLYLSAPQFWVLAINFGMSVLTTKIDVEVPARRKTGSTSIQSTEIYTLSAARQIGSLPSAPPSKTLRNYISQRSAAEVARQHNVFKNNRDDAISLIRERLSRAKRTVVFIDPYFNNIDLREFSSAITNSTVQIHVLRDNGDDLFGQASPNDARMLGDALAQDLEHLELKLKQSGLAAPAVRIMGNDIKYHDRFLLIDDELWHFGHSFNKIGGPELSIVDVLPRDEELIQRINDDVKNAELFKDAWQRIGQTERQCGMLLWIKRALKTIINCK